VSIIIPLLQSSRDQMRDIYKDITSRGRHDDTGSFREIHKVMDDGPRQ